MNPMCSPVTFTYRAAMVDTLTNKVTAWEKERDNDFIYDGVSI